jgi:ATP-binding cassette subfamily C (CFTR/MRP) protein 1
MIFSIPLNTTIARMLKKMQEEQMKNRDRRTRLMSELLANIKRYVSLMYANDLINDRDSCSIKLYAWEYAFVRRVLHVRNDLELKMLKKIGIVTVRIDFQTEQTVFILAHSSGSQYDTLGRHSLCVPCV